MIKKLKRCPGIWTNKRFLLLITICALLFLASCTNTKDSSNIQKVQGEIDLFADVVIAYDGWNDFGEVVKINVENCEEFIRENVAFSLKEDYCELANGDMVTVIAEYDQKLFNKKGITVTNNSKTFTVSGLKQIAVAQDFHDDVAWVNVEFIDGSRWCCCDKNGEILFMLDGFEQPTTCFANGVAIVNHSKIINKTGEIIWSIEENGMKIANELWGSGNVTKVEILFDNEEDADEEYFGYTFVKFYIDSYELTAEMTGILDPEGNWYLEPVDYFVFNSYEECGIYNYSGTKLYNILTNEFAEDHFTGDYDKWYDTYHAERHNGLIFDGWSSDHNFFYNLDGKEVINLSRYTLISYADDPEFNEGYALLEIENEQGSHYYTIIDTNGKEMFPPQKGVEHGELRCGYYWVDNMGYLNVYGKLAFDISLISGSAFNEDVAVVQTESGNVHYMDVNGKILF